MMSDHQHDLYYRTALVTAVLSAGVVILLVIFVPIIILKANYERQTIVARSDMFRNNTNKLWSRMLDLNDKRGRKTRNSGYDFGGNGNSFLPNGYKAPNKDICGGGGRSGRDGNPSGPGKSGSPGEDGYDVQLEPELDLPCVICPAGPPGPRGLQGERGRAGQQGAGGQVGVDGLGGPDGQAGDHGEPGLIGFKGPIGVVGPKGKTAVGGRGVRGLKGPLGPPGPKGPPGTPGKAVNVPGGPGNPGSLGPPGSVGAKGLPGLEGSWGLPGESGLPGTYCPSDCGVSEILAPIIRTGGHYTTTKITPSSYNEYYDYTR